MIGGNRDIADVGIDIVSSRTESEASRTNTNVHSRSAKRRVLGILLVGAIVAALAVALAPIGTTSATPTREGGACSGCHEGAQTPSMLTVTGLPSGTYVPGQPYTITITITDTNGNTINDGQNNFDIIATAGTFSSPDANTEVNSATEASTLDSADHYTLTSGSVVWTAPASGSVTIDVWAVMGDGATGTLDIWDHETYTSSEIPEFTILILPLIGVVGIVVLASRAMKK